MLYLQHCLLNLLSRLIRKNLPKEIREFQAGLDRRMGVQTVILASYKQQNGEVACVKYVCTRVSVTSIVLINHRFTPPSEGGESQKQRKKWRHNMWAVFQDYSAEHFGSYHILP